MHKRQLHFALPPFEQPWRKNFGVIRAAASRKSLRALLTLNSLMHIADPVTGYVGVAVIQPRQNSGAGVNQPCPAIISNGRYFLLSRGVRADFFDCSPYRLFGTTNTPVAV